MVTPLGLVEQSLKILTRPGEFAVLTKIVVEAVGAVQIARFRGDDMPVQLTPPVGVAGDLCISIAVSLPSRKPHPLVGTALFLHTV